MFDATDFPEEGSGGIGLNDNDIKRLSDLCFKQKQAEGKVARLEKELKEAKEELTTLSDDLVPALMQELNVREFILSSGAKISVKKVYFGSIAQERAWKACEWLRENGYAALVKNELTLSFGKGEDAEAERAAELLVENGLTPSTKEYVHPMTLKAWVKEMYEAGNTFPEELFAAGVRDVASVTLPKEAKPHMGVLR
jgi:hypothetical protein